MQKSTCRGAAEFVPDMRVSKEMEAQSHWLDFACVVKGQFQQLIIDI